MTIGERVDKLRTNLNMTQQELADASGLSFTFINYLENGKRKNPSQKTITALAKALTTTAEYLIGGSVEVHKITGTKQIPIISWVQAGKWHDAIDAYPPGVAEDWIPYETKSNGVFALRVKGNSMEPEYREGDIIMVNPQLEAHIGDHIIAKVGDQVTFKKLRKQDGTVLLSPLNTEHPDIIITGKDLKSYRVIGVVESFTRKRKRK